MSEPVDAGPFGAWLSMMAEALDGRVDADVACGSCVACCSSRQFVHIEPDERDALAHIPAELLFPAPRAPRGHVVMGYDEHGRCPMLGPDGCTIYAHRPRTCRTYDCRVFPAAGVFPDEPDKVSIAERARRWVFSHEDDAAREAHRAVLAAAAAQPADLPATPRAVTAVRLVLRDR